MGLFRLWLLIVLSAGVLPQVLADGPDPVECGSRYAFEAGRSAAPAAPPDDREPDDDRDDDDGDDQHGHALALPPVRPDSPPPSIARARHRQMSALLPSSADADPPLHVPRA